MNARIERLRKKSFEATPCISIERALIETEFYKKQQGKHSIPVLRALVFKELCAQKTIYIGDDELIVGERGPFPKSVSTFPELTCHTAEDLRILNNRAMTRFKISEEDIDRYAEEVVPFWQGRSMRERVFSQVPEAWTKAYRAGLFTEFMEQRAAGHTTLDGTIYQKGMLDLKNDIAQALARLDYLEDKEAMQKAETLKAMDIACDAAIVFAERHADLAAEMAANEKDPQRKIELETIAAVCRRVPAHAPENLHEALQMYWFVHLGTITELNGWDAMNPGRLDQHLFPFFQKGLADGSLDREKAKELISCLWVKVNNHPAPPKVGVTAKESGTYNDFTNINLGGLRPDGTDGVNEVSYIILEVIDELHLLQPQSNVQISDKTPDRFSRPPAGSSAKGMATPRVFNADEVIMEQIRVGKTVEDAREGGCSGCIETGAFGKEAYILTGYLNVPKILELALNNGLDPVSGEQLGPETGDPRLFENFDELYAAFTTQLEYVVDLKIRVNNYIERMFAENAPAPFLSVVIQDCIKNGKDYYNGGPRYNTNYIQCCGIGTITDSLSALKTHVFEEQKRCHGGSLEALKTNFENNEALRLKLWNKTPFFGNDDDRADAIMQQVYASLFKAIDGKPNTKGTEYHLNMLSTTCHIYFGKMLGATPNGRFAELPVSDGTSPSHGADRNGPTAVVKSLGKMDQVKSGGTLLNQRFPAGCSQDGTGSGQTGPAHPHLLQV
jgi:pyruvate formate-lyase/glycerol dehydratase family glycyl radical enzyme